MSFIETTARAAWRARYGEGEPPAALNELAAQLLNHRSVRAYDRREVGEDALRLAVAAAQSASTSSNLQAWSVIAVRDRARLQKLAVLCGEQRHVAEAPLFLAWVVDLSRLRRVGQAQGIPAEGTDYLEMYTVGVVDAALAAQNAVAVFESLGMGIVYIGGMRNHPEAVAEELGLPPGCMALFGMCVGYPDPARPADIKPRLSQRAVLHHERYDAQDEAALVGEYDARMSAFQRGQQRGDRPWSRVAAERVRGPESLSGRHRLREALAALGLALR